MKKSEINILIIDDDKSSGTVLSESVKRMGFKSHVVTKPEDALQVVKIKAVQLAIIDVLLPKMSGVDLATEIRKARFGGAPIILISGIFKDKAFAAEAMRKSGAIEFLFKPFGYEDLNKAVQHALEPILSIEKWTVQSLLTRRLTSHRDRVKAIEKLGDVKGNHLPIVLSMLMDADTSGHMNIVSDKEEIYGLTVHKGLIVDGDSTALNQAVLMSLIEQGYLAQEDTAAFVEKGNEEGLVSPHAIAKVKRQQIFKLIDQLSNSVTFQVNFVPSEVETPRYFNGIAINDLLGHLRQYPEVHLGEEFLNEFYQPVMSAPMCHNESRGILSKDIEHLLNKNLSIEESIKASDKNTLEILREVHLAFIGRQIHFDDLAKVKSLDTLLERFERLYSEFKIRQAHEIFEYFGAAGDVSGEALTRIYNDYVDANHPDRLPRGASEELRSLCQRCFEAITQAYQTLSSDEGREQYAQEIRAQKGEKQAYVHTLSEEGMDHLRRGQAQAALSMFKEAYKILPSPRLMMLTIWSDIKVQGNKPDREMLHNFNQQLDAMSFDDKKTPLYFMALGLVKRALGDGRAAQGCFEKVVQLDPAFVEARRELNSISTQIQGAKKLDILNGDITEVVSQIFRRKKS